MRKTLLGGLAALVFAAGAAQAAFINVDDSNPGTYTITAGDFEGGLTIFDATGAVAASTSGIGNSLTITFADGLATFATFEGNWVGSGAAGVGSANVFFIQGIDNVTSGFQSDWEKTAFVNNSTVNSRITGTLGGFDGNVYFNGPGFPQDGRIETSGAPNLFISIISENPERVPEPASLLLLASGLLGLGAVSRRKA